VTLYHGDALELASELPMVDCLLTDPPFFMPATHYQTRNQWQRTWGDTSVLKTFWQQFCKQLLPKVRRTGHVLTFCNHESYPVFYPVMYGEFDYLKCIVWDKQHFGMGKVWRNQHELIIAARWDGSIFNEDGKTRCDVLKHRVTESETRLHPVEKPESLLADLLLPTTAPGQIVLDPFAGSGSTLIAAKSHGRKAIGIECEEKYCEVIASRCAQEVLTLGEG
jgi:site-specific DNA-methyltransferase (adenine-specific)